MQETKIQRSVELDGHLLVADIENGKQTINGFVKLGNYRYNFLEDDITCVQPDKNNGYPINKKAAIERWNKLKNMLEENHYVDEAHFLSDGYKTFIYHIKPNGNIHLFEDILLADYCNEKYPDKLVYINGVLYFTPKYKIMIERIGMNEVLRDTGIKTSIKGKFNPKQDLISIETDYGFKATEEQIAILKEYLISRQIKVSDVQYKITGYNNHIY